MNANLFTSIKRPLLKTTAYNRFMQNKTHSNPSTSPIYTR